MKKIIIAIVAAMILPFGSTAEAAQPQSKKKTTTTKTSSHHSSSHHSSHSSSHHSTHHSSSTSSKTVSYAKASSDSASKAKVTTAATAENVAANVSSESIIKTAMQYIGVPYRHGTSSGKSFDCSGFTSFVYNKYGISLSRASRAQYTQGKHVAKSDLRPGDLVFFQGSSGKGGVGHVAIVTEVDKKNDTFKFVHARNRGVGVDDIKMSYYSRRFIGARRVLSDEEDKK